MLFSKKKEKEESYLDWKKREYKKSDKENKRIFKDTSDLKKRYDAFCRHYEENSNKHLISVGRTAAWEVAGCMSSYYYGVRLLTNGKKKLPTFPTDVVEENRSLFLKWIIILKVLRTAFNDDNIVKNADIFEKDAMDFIDCCISRYDVFLNEVGTTELELCSIDKEMKREGGLFIQEMIWEEFIGEYKNIEQSKEWSELYCIMRKYNELAYKEQKACLFAPIGLPEYPADVKILC